MWRRKYGRCRGGTSRGHLDVGTSEVCFSRAGVMEMVFVVRPVLVGGPLEGRYVHGNCVVLGSA